MLTDLLIMQGALDNYAGFISGSDRKTAYLSKSIHIFIELGEMLDDLVNEKDGLVEELVDVLHFTLGAAYSPFVKIDILQANWRINDIYEEQVLTVGVSNKHSLTNGYLIKFLTKASSFFNGSHGMKDWKKNGVSFQPQKATDHFVELTESLICLIFTILREKEISVDQFEDAYREKHRKNYQRQMDNY